jgi:methylmalonyl-CoA/ethylmalonyl-CoA epimerase
MLPHNHTNLDLSFLSDCRLDHVAIAVTDLETSIKFYQLLGLKFSLEREEIVSEKVRVAFAAIDGVARLELLQSTSNDGPIAKYIEKKGPGLHHLCFLVKDAAKKQMELEAAGMQFIYDKLRQGANNRLINFIHPKSTGGVLIELSQKI